MPTTVQEFSALALSHSDMRQLVMKNQLLDGMLRQPTSPLSWFIAVERFNLFMAGSRGGRRSIQDRKYLFIEVDCLAISLLPVPPKKLITHAVKNYAAVLK